MPQSEILKKIIQNMESVIVGKRRAIELALITLLSDGHLLLEDVPGVGKTTLGKALAQSVQCSFARIQFTPDTLPGDVIGMSMYQINRTSPKTQASLLEAMEEQQVTVDGITYALPELFMVIATQNPVEQLGTYRLPEAQLDRFMMKISMGYPETPADEADIVRRMVDGEPLKKLSPVTTRDELMQIKDEVKAVAVHQDVMAYAVEITRNTRKSRYLSLGASPRAAIALVRAAKSRAYLEGRMYTTPEDIAALAPPVLLHRLILSSEARLEGKNEREMLQEAMRAAHVPVL